MMGRKSPVRPTPRLAETVSVFMAAMAAALLGGLVAGCSPSKPARLGDVLFAENCARCHGADGTGDPRILPLYPRADLSRSPMGAARERLLIHDRIARGYTTMPGFQGKLEPEEIGSLVNKCLALAAPAGSKAGGAPSPNGG